MHVPRIFVWLIFAKRKGKKKNSFFFSALLKINIYNENYTLIAVNYRGTQMFQDGLFLCASNVGSAKYVHTLFIKNIYCLICLE